MADSDISSEELGSWKEIARHLGVTVRTAQKWGAERGLPVKRLSGPRGRVRANLGDLDRWRRNNLGKRRWSASLRLFRISSVATSALLLIEIGALIGVYVQQLHQGPPARFRYDFRSLLVTDEQGHELWRKTFEDGFLPGGTPELKLASKGAWFGDLDGDGHVEFLYIHDPADRDSRGSTVYCFSDKGREKWRFVPGRVVKTATDTFAPPFVSEAIAVTRIGQGPKRVIVSSRHATFYPAQVVVLSSAGKILGEYWHSGHLPNVETADLDGDGTEEILLAGVNTVHKMATLVVLDSRNAGGASEEAQAPSHQIQGFAPGREKARILFPRTCINQKLGRFSVAGRLSMNAGEIHVRTWEWYTRLAGQLGVGYTLNKNLEVAAVVYPDRLRALHRELELAGQLDHSLTEQEVQRMRDVRVLKPWSPAAPARSPGRK
jgi:hypothetical protein